MTSSEKMGQADPKTYDALLQAKAKLTYEQFKKFFSGTIDVYASPKSHYRMRAEFKIWHEGDTAFYVMHEKNDKGSVVKIEWEFSIGSQVIVETMPALLAEINRSPHLKNKLFQIEFLTSRSKECLVTLIYHKRLDDTWISLAKELSKKLGMSVIGRSRKQKVILDKDYIFESFKVAQDVYKYQQVESGFTQPNAIVCEKMLNWVVENTNRISGDLVELYCGNGNFTLPLSKNFRQVLATEISKTSVKSALYNITQNNITNIAVARMSAEEFTQALNGEREFRRLEGVDLSSYNFSTIFVDPPRAGLDENTRNLVCQFDNIIYISCNPETLQRDLSTICHSHSVNQIALFDQFPYTDHRECGVILKKL